MNPARGAARGAAGGRILGWDLLRGICAVTVAFYHLSYWLGLAELPALGTYGVYLFFVLSGASLAYVYPVDAVRSMGDAGRFLATRWLRLAPLYLLLCVVFIAMLAVRNGALADHLGWRLLLNASFGFGLYDPALWAILIGGWSLGIEFVYYLCFPLLARVLPHRALAVAVFLVLVSVQFGWIQATVGSKGWGAVVADYHQAPAFAAYFFGGCLLGHWQRSGAPAWPEAAGWLAAVAWVGLLLLLMPRDAGDELLGLRGLALFFACFAAVHVSGRARLGTRTARLAAWFGDVTYGTYLLHPMLFFSIAWLVALPLTGSEPQTWSAPARWATLVGVIAIATGLAGFSERRFERPLRRWSRKRLAKPGAQSDAASISS